MPFGSGAGYGATGNPLTRRLPQQPGGPLPSIAGGLDAYIRNALSPQAQGVRGVPPVPLYNQDSPITIGGIFNPQQIQERVNTMRAQNEASAGGEARNIQQQTAASGYGTNSPLAMALQNSLQGRTMALNAQLENDFRFGAAGENAKHLLATETASAEQSKNFLRDWLDFYLRDKQLNEQIRQFQIQSDPRHAAAMAATARAGGTGQGRPTANPYPMPMMGQQVISGPMLQRGMFGA